MTKRKPGDILKSMQQHPYRGRGAVYRWLRLNHQEVMDGFALTAAPWDTVVTSMIRDGITGQRGALPNRNAVAKVWERVCRDIRSDAIELRTGIPQRKHQPSRMSATWRPIPETAPTPATSSRPVTPQPFPPARDGEARPRTAEEKVADIRQQFARRSGR